MTTTVEEPAVAPEPPEPPEAPEHPTAGSTVGLTVLRVISAAAIPIILFALLWLTFDFLREADANRFALAGVALVVGVVGVFVLYWAMNRLVDYLPATIRGGVRPYVFVGPALVILAVFLVYPVINTIIISFGDSRGEGFVGLDNYEFVFTDESMLRSIRNTLGWIVIVPLVAVSVGLAFATLADRLRRGEQVAKSLIFMPMSPGGSSTASALRGSAPTSACSTG